MDGKIIKKCRLCNNKKLDRIINFGKIPLGNNLLSQKKLSKKAKKYPLILNNCKSCNHFQLNYSVNPKILYAKNYTYLSGTGKSMVIHLKKYADEIIKKINLKKNNIILDIGSNDGTCLLNFQKRKMTVLGIDPATKPCKVAKSKGIDSINNFFDKKTVRKVERLHGKVDFITSHNTLAHVDNLKSIFKNIHYILKYNGHFCFEVGYFKKVLNNNYFDTIYHEHLDYHHANPLVNFLTSIGFSIVDISMVKIQGGSLRILCKKDDKKNISKKALLFLKKEKRTVIFDKKFIMRWEKNIKAIMLDTRKKIIKKISNHKIFGYGSPTKIILFLKMLNLPRNKVKYIFEDNKLKQNKYLPIYGNKIVCTSEIKKLKPKFILIFAWNFKDDIKKKVYKINNKINLMVPLPKFKVI